MAKYQIKATYKGGRHNGEEYILTKGGYIATADFYQMPYFCYNRLADAKRSVTLYNKKYPTEDDSNISYEIIEVK